MKKHLPVFTIILITCIGICEAVAPQPGPNRHLEYSRNRKHLAICDPKDGIKITDPTTEKVIWAVPNWYRKVVLSNDGKKLVAALDRGQAFPVDTTDDVAILTFFKEGKLIKEVRFKDLFPGKKPIREDGYFYQWGTMVGFNDDGLLEVIIEGDRVIYDADKAKIVQRVPIESK